MATSSTDFQWYHDVDDEYPIDQDLTPTADPPIPCSSAGPSNRVRQLCGQPKVAIKSPSTHRTPAKATSNTRHKNPWKQPHSDDNKGSTRKLRETVAARRKKEVAIKLEMDDTASTDHDLSSDDGSDLSVKDNCVCLFCIVWLSTDTIYYRNAPAVTVSVAETSAVSTSILCMTWGPVLKVAKC